MEIIDSKESLDFIDKMKNQSKSKNTIISRDKSIKYWEAWYEATFNKPMIYPIWIPIVVKFISDHIGGLNKEVDKKLVASGIKNKLGTHTLNTVKRRVYTQSSYHDQMGYNNPCRNKTVSGLLEMVKKAQINNGISVTKKDAATADILEKLIATCCSGNLVDVRDKALLLVGFSSGGRRRSELSEMTFENLKQVPGGFTIKINHSKGDYQDQHKEYPILNVAAKALKEWLKASDITSGPLFRGLTKYETIKKDRLAPVSINGIIKKRAKLAGLNKISAHSLRSGFITEAARKSIPVWDIMQMTNHKSSKSVDDYYRSGSILNNQAAKLI
jgi:integrase